jgi:hypothetical protein
MPFAASNGEKNGHGSGYNGDYGGNSEAVYDHSNTPLINSI